MNIKTFIALAVVSLTTACADAPEAPAPVVVSDETVPVEGVDTLPEPKLGENEKPR